MNELARNALARAEEAEATANLVEYWRREAEREHAAAENMRNTITRLLKERVTMENSLQVKRLVS